MEINMKEKQENRLLHRTEIILEVKSKTTPSRKELMEKIAELEKAKRENIIVDKVKREFGKQKTIVTAKVYESNVFLKKLEPEYKIVKNFPELRKEKEEKETRREEESKEEKRKEKGIMEKPEREKKEKKFEKKERS